MKKVIISSLFVIISISYSFCQVVNNPESFSKKITLLKNNTYEIKEFTEDSLLIYKGTLSSIEPEVRHGRFYFYDNKGKVIASGLYNYDIPYGTWIYFGESYDTIRSVNYSAVWEYLEKDAFDFTIDSTVLKSLKKKDKETMNPDGTFYLVEKMPSFNGGDPLDEFDKYIKDNMIFPIYASRKGFGGSVKTQFVIDSKGKIRNPVIQGTLISDLNIEIIRVLFESPLWEPGYQSNQPVNVNLIWPFSFSFVNKLSINPGLLKKEGKSDNEDKEVYLIVEDMPKFNGGDPVTEFRKHIFNNLRYPELAAEEGKSGRVIVQFAVSETGELEDAVVVVSVDPALDKEALRVVNSSPKWEPGYQKGKPVTVLFTFPINFVLQ